MRVGLIGRSELVYNTAKLLLENGYQIPLIITSKEAPEYKVTHKDFEKLANEISAVFLYTPKVNFSEHKKIIDECGGVDLVISVNYTGVIPQDIINLFPYGILNAHAGDLPKYRGNAPLAWALINNEDKVGLCVHKMKGGELDSGDIIARSYKNITINTRVGELLDWVENQIPELMLIAVKKLQNNADYILEIQSKDPNQALRCYPRHPDDGKINWSDSNEKIVSLINASSEPFQGAYCFYKSERMIIWRAELYQDNELYSAIPGQICNVLIDSSIVVSTGNGKIKVTNVEYLSERTAPAKIVKSLRGRFK